MKFLHKYGTRSNEIRRARKELQFRLILLIGAGFFIFAMIMVAKFRPRLDSQQAGQLPEVANLGDPLGNPQLIDMRARVEALEAAFDEQVVSPSGDVDPLQPLEEAIQIQRAVIRMRGSEIAPRSDIERLEGLLSRLDEAKGSSLLKESKQLEASAEALLAQGQQAGALAALEKALSLQQRLNDEHPRSSARDPSRLLYLSNKRLQWITQPLADQADALMEQALADAGEGRFDKARSTMRRALQLQQDLNDQYRGTRAASLSRLRAFSDAWESVQTAEDTAVVERLLAEARLALQTEQTDLAFSRAEEAEGRQKQLLERFPSLASRHQPILEEIIALKETAASLPAYQAILDQGESVRQQLRTRQVDSLKNPISEWFRAAQLFRRNFPRSQLAEMIQLEEVTFLHDHREELPALLDTVHANLLPVPGYSHLELYRSEIPQVLYTRVMGDNPSSVQGPTLPVESVTWAEARDFARRLSWILARPVNLPDREVYLAALGSVDRATVLNHAWASENSRREIQAVGGLQATAGGFHDLLGNVAEWLESTGPDTPERSFAIGGSARDSMARLLTVPQESRSPDERNRFVGFRLMVNMEI